MNIISLVDTCTANPNPTSGQVTITCNPVPSGNVIEIPALSGDCQPAFSTGGEVICKGILTGSNPEIIVINPEYPEVITGVIPVIVDTTAPTGDVSYAPDMPTTENVIATIITDEPIKTPAGWTKIDDTHFTKEYDDNRSGNVVIEDLAGNTGNVEVFIDFIDTSAPVAVNVTYTPDTATSGNVQVTLEVDRPVKPIAGWNGATGTIFTKTYTDNILTTVIFYDHRGKS